MPSQLHEGLIALVRDRPAFVAELLRRLLHVEVPRFTDARLAEATLTELVPVEYHADAVVLFVDGQPVFGAIVEAQLQRDDRKRFTWPLYGATARARHECPFVVIVVTPDPQVAIWASQPIDMGGGNRFCVHVIGPQGIPKVTDHAMAMREPQLAVLSVVAHGKGDPDTAIAIALAAADAVLQFPGEQQLLYSALIESALSDAARKALAMLPQAEKFFSESQRRSYDRGLHEGEARGAAHALLLVLQQRKLAISEPQRRRVTECTDIATLNRWLERAFAVSSVDELLG